MKLVQTQDKQSNCARDDVIDWLLIEKQDLAEKEILISERVVIDRLLSREVEARSAFLELHSSLKPFQWQAYLSTLLSTAAFWNPKAIEGLREAEKRLSEINTEISDAAEKLAALLKERTDLAEQHGFHVNDTYHIVDLIDQVSERNGYYRSWVRDDLLLLRTRFDLEYWPSLSEVVTEIGTDAERAVVEPSIDITRAAIGSRKSSRRDFIRAFFEAIRENSESVHAHIPDDFALSDESLATLINCSLDLSEQDIIDGQYVKAARQQIRKNENSHNVW